jgi:glucose-6-phosphate isomerase
VAETTSITQRPAWQALAAHYRQIKDVHLKTLFAQDATRGERFMAEAAGLYLDYAKHRVTDETLCLLLNLAAESGLRERIDAMCRGEKINIRKLAHRHTARRAQIGRGTILHGPTGGSEAFVDVDTSLLFGVPHGRCLGQKPDTTPSR